MKREERLMRYVNTIPKTPGVYEFFRARELLYIGKAANLRDRVKSHYRAPSYQDRLFMGKVTRVAYLETPSEIDALLLEASLIKKRQPKYNVIWKDDKKYFYIEITKEPLPRVSLTHQPNWMQITKHKPQITIRRLADKTQNTDSAHSIGPFTDGRALKFALRVLRRVFPYYASTKKHGVLPCGYCHIDLCPGPSPDAKSYRASIKKLKAVLEGKRTSVMRAIQAEMKRESARGEFERAGRLRDQYFALEKIAAHGVAAMPLSAPPLEYEAISQELSHILRTTFPISRIEEFDVSNIQGKHAVGSMVVFVHGRSAPSLYRKFAIRGLAAPNDVAMMNEIVSRRLKHQEWDMPDLLIVDGGRGQLSTALAAIRESALPRAFVTAALAKGKNELFVENRKDPIPLKTMSEDLRHMLTRIKDEAHRFAVSFHRKRRSVDTLQGA